MVKRAARPGRRTEAAGGVAAAAAKLPEPAETLLRQVFSVQGSLPPAQAAAVAVQTGCTSEAALAFFLEMHAATKTCLKRAVERAAEEADQIAEDGGFFKGAGGTKGGGAAVIDEEAQRAAVAAGAAARQAAAAKLRALLDTGGSGGLKDMSVIGQFVSFMSSLASNIVRSQAARAIAASRKTILNKIVGTAGFLTVLEEWLEAARQQDQYTLLQDVLQALAALPLEARLVRSSTDLHRTVRRLQAHPHTAVAAAAEGLYAKWQQLLGGAPGLGPAIGPGRFANSSFSAGVKSLAPAGDAVPGEPALVSSETRHQQGTVLAVGASQAVPSATGTAGGASSAVPAQLPTSAHDAKRQPQGQQAAGGEVGQQAQQQQAQAQQKRGQQNAQQQRQQNAQQNEEQLQQAEAQEQQQAEPVQHQRAAPPRQAQPVQHQQVHKQEVSPVQQQQQQLQSQQPTVKMEPADRKSVV